MPPADGHNGDADQDGQKGIEETRHDVGRDLQLVESGEDADDHDGDGGGIGERGAIRQTAERRADQISRGRGDGRGDHVMMMAAMTFGR